MENSNDLLADDILKNRKDIEELKERLDVFADWHLDMTAKHNQFVLDATKTIKRHSRFIIFLTTGAAAYFLYKTYCETKEAEEETIDAVKKG